MTTQHKKLISDQLEWIVTIRRIMEEETEITYDQPISIFEVPKALLAIKPESYVPQLVSLGPYHHFCEDLRHMERYKIGAAKRVQNLLPNMMRFHDLVDIFVKLEHHIRAHYHRHLNFNGETLGWMMAIDTSFLLEFLQMYSTTKDKIIQRIPSRMLHLLVDSKHRTTAHNAIIRDVIMLENQIPIFLLLKILEIQNSSHQITEDQTLAGMFIGFLKEISPFKNVETLSCSGITQFSHLLDFIYCNIVPKYEDKPCDPSEGGKNGNQETLTLTCLKNIAIKAINVTLDRARKLLSLIIRLLIRIPLKILATLPIISVFRQPIEEVLLSSQLEQGDKMNNKRLNTSPLLEEISIPSVEELISAGIKIHPTSDGISTIDFCTKKGILYLPVISLNINTDVLLRNLIAYEASIGSNRLIFSRYIELMNGIIDTENDARLLREMGIVLNYLKSDTEVAELWNGMTRSIKLTHVPHLDQVIEEVNKFYNSKWRVKLKRFFMKHKVLSSLKNVIWVLVLFSLVLFVMGLEAFCMTYSCVPSFSMRR